MLLADGEFKGLVVLFLVQTDQAKHAENGIVVVVAVPPDVYCQLQILPRRERREEVEPLENVAYVVPSDSRALDLG